MKSLVYLLLMLLTAAISDDPENEKFEDRSSKCLKARSSCTVKSVCTYNLEQRTAVCTNPEGVS